VRHNYDKLIYETINRVCSFNIQGIYRQAGQENKIKQLLVECLDDPFNCSLNRDNYNEHDVACALKRFLRQSDMSLLGTRQNYQAWLRSTVDMNMTSDYFIPYYRALLKDLKQQYPIHYSTLRKMLMHVQTVSMLSHINGMTVSNLIRTLAPCLVSQLTSTWMNCSTITVDNSRTNLSDKNPISSIDDRSVDNLDECKTSFESKPTLSMKCKSCVFNDNTA
jgi:hypothetical protein